MAAPCSTDIISRASVLHDAYFFYNKELWKIIETVINQDFPRKRKDDEGSGICSHPAPG